MSVQKNIRRVRLAKGVTQTAVANYLGISRMSYNRLELSSVNIDPNFLPKIANFLETDMKVFFDDKLTESVMKIKQST